jgi:hypothetical protein
MANSSEIGLMMPGHGGAIAMMRSWLVWIAITFNP